MKPSEPVNVTFPAEATAEVLAYYHAVTSHRRAPAGATPSVERSGRTNTPRRSTRRCERCGKLLARTSPNTRQDIPLHKICFAMNEEERVAANPPAPLAGSPLKDLLW